MQVYWVNLGHFRDPCGKVPENMTLNFREQRLIFRVLGPTGEGNRTGHFYDLCYPMLEEGGLPPLRTKIGI